MNLVKNIDKNYMKSLKQDSINALSEFIIANADGKNIAGNGIDFVYETDYVKVTHDFVDGIYIRRMDMAKGCLVVGGVHKHLHVWFLLKGHVTISSNDSVEDYEAPCIVKAKPGTQRIILANEESIFVNVHKNPLEHRNINDIEKEFVSINMDEYNKYKKEL